MVVVVASVVVVLIVADDCIGFGQSSTVVHDVV